MLREAGYEFRWTGFEHGESFFSRRLTCNHTDATAPAIISNDLGFHFLTLFAGGRGFRHDHLDGVELAAIQALLTSTALFCIDNSLEPALLPDLAD